MAAETDRPVGQSQEGDASAQFYRGLAEAGEAGEYGESDRRFAGALEAICGNVPEIGRDLEQIRAAGSELIRQYGVRPELFDDSANALFFAAIAQRQAQLAARSGEVPADVLASETEFIENALVLLAGDKADSYPDFKARVDARDEVPPPELVRIYDRFTNVQVSRELRQAIDEGGLLDGVKARLGVTAENEDEFELRVLNVGDDSTLFGVTPSMPEGAQFGSPEAAAWGEDEKAARAWREGLKGQAEEFKRLTGWDGVFPAAWTSFVDGKKVLNIPLPTAEKILYKDQERARYYDQHSLDRDKAVLEHEYTHTQGGYNRGASAFYGAIDFYGAAAEELRAEEFAGNKSAYHDVKGFLANDFLAMTGVDLRGYMHAHPKGGEAGEFYAMIANTVGAQKALELAVVPPHVYLEDSRPMQKDVANAIGGPDGFTKALYEQIMSEPERAAAMDGRLNRWAAALDGSSSSGALDFDDWTKRRKRQGLVFVTDIIASRVYKIRASRSGEQAA